MKASTPWMIVLLAGSMASTLGAAEKVGDRLWTWGHPAAVYNDSFLKPLGKKSTVEPVTAAEALGTRNMIFVRYGGPPAPFDEYYRPFRRLDRVYWSLVAAGGETSQVDREAAFSLAEKNPNLAGFILDDFFHEPGHGNAADPIDGDRIWLAANRPEFPVLLTATFAAAVEAEEVELAQTAWGTGDYRARGVEVEVSSDGRRWETAGKGVVPNQPGAALRLPLGQQKLVALRLRFLDTHDRQGALSVGLAGLRLLAHGQPLDVAGAKISASSTYAGFDAQSLFAPPDAPGAPFRASLSPRELEALGQRKVRGKRLPIMAVVYTRQIKPRAKAHLDLVDEICMWTWRPADLANLEANFAALEKLAPGKPIYLGCYTYDFDACKPLPVDLMRRQVESGLNWLRAGRIAGMIFLATPNFDVGLEAVDWTRDWVRRHADLPLERSSGPSGRANGQLPRSPRARS